MRVCERETERQRDRETSECECVCVCVCVRERERKRVREREREREREIAFSCRESLMNRSLFPCKEYATSRDSFVRARLTSKLSSTFMYQKKNYQWPVI